MNRQHNTPGLRTPEPSKRPTLTGKALLYKLEDDYADYRSDCNKGYCRSDPAVHAKFKADIVAARTTESAHPKTKKLVELLLADAQNGPPLSHHEDYCPLSDHSEPYNPRESMSVGRTGGWNNDLEYMQAQGDSHHPDDSAERNDQAFGRPVTAEVLSQAFQIMHSHAMGAEMDAGFDAGEWSGPAHDEMEYEALQKLAAKNGVRFTDLMQAITAASNEDEGANKVYRDHEDNNWPQGPAR